MGSGGLAEGGALLDPRRLEALRRLAILDTPSDVPFERLTEMAVDLLGVPIALVTLVDDERQFFKCQIGLPEPYASLRETPLSHSFCRHVVDSGEPLVISDAREHEVLRSNLAIPDIGVIAYAGIPLTTSDRLTLGTFCAIDTKPRTWTPRDLELLRVLAAAAMSVIELHAEREEARKVHTRHGVLTDAATDAIIVIDEQSTIIDANKSVEEMFGYPRAELVGENLRLIQAPRLQAGHTAGVERYLRTGERTVSWKAATVTARHRSGREFPVEIAFGEFDESGAHRFLGVIRDRSEHDRLESQLRQAQKMEAVGQLAGGIAHDFNNLLTAIIGYTELVDDAVDPDDPVRQDLSQIQRAADRATAMTRQLLAFSRREVIEPVVLDPADAITEIVPLLGRLIGDHIELIVDAPAGNGAVRIDPTHLDQVIINIAVNARDAMPDGGKLTITLRTTRTAPDGSPGRGERGARWIELTMADTGAGIDPDAREHVFDPFFTTKEIGQGTGLGLATVYGIVQQASGVITIDSEPGAGATFRIFLPRVDGELSARRSSSRRARPRVHGAPAVLVVEDEAALRKLAARVLERHGCAVVTASDGPTALRQAARMGRIDLLITDLVLPGESGWSIARAIREGRGDLPILYISGYSGDHGGDIGRLDPAGEFLAKPFTGDELVMRVTEILGDATEKRP